MNVEMLQKKMDNFFNEVTAEELVNQLKELGYEIVDINESKAFDLANVTQWVAVSDRLPKPLETVWLSNGKGWTTLGCVVQCEEGYHWAESNGVIYEEKGEIVSECESDDLDVKYWHPLPKPPCG